LQTGRWSGRARVTLHRQPTFQEQGYGDHRWLDAAIRSEGSRGGHAPQRIDLAPDGDGPQRPHPVDDGRRFLQGRLLRLDPLLADSHKLVTRVRTTAVAYWPAQQPKKRRRGRPKIYGKKLRLKQLWKQQADFSSAPSPVYGESTVEIRYLSLDLLWRPVGRLVRFVWVDHPIRGRIILMSTLLSLTPLEVIQLYGYRFKIEVSFKQALHTLGAYSYHFWMMHMTPLGRRSGNQHLHHKTEKYREMVRSKMAAYHRYVQLGCIAQGLLQYLSVRFGSHVWKHFNSWLRTMDPNRSPSEMVVGRALRSSLPHLLSTMHGEHELEKTLVENEDLSRLPSVSLSA
jgi:hypothetical protein